MALNVLCTSEWTKNDDVFTPKPTAAEYDDEKWEWGKPAKKNDNNNKRPFFGRSEEEEEEDVIDVSPTS